MRTLALALLAASLLACRASNEVELGMVDPARFKRVGVLPFADARWRGRKTAELVARGLFERGYDVVDLRQMETVFGALRLDYSAGISIESLAEVRRRTRAEALLFGTIDSRWTEVSLMMIDTELGESVLTAKLRPRRRGPFAGPEAVAEEVALLVSAKPHPRLLEGVSEIAPPQ